MRLIHYDRFDAMLEDLQPTGGVTRTRNVDGTDTIEFNTVQQVSQADRIVLTDSMGRVREYMVSSIDESRSSSRPVAKVTAVDAVNELAGVFVLDQRNRGTNAKACLSKLLDGTRWTVGTVQNGTTTVSADLSVYHESAYDGLQDICDTYGLELETSYEPDASGTGIGRRIISLLESRGNPSATKRFSYAKDLTSIRRTITAELPITRCYGYGKGLSTASDEDEDTTGYGRKLTFADVNDGKEYVEDDDALKIYGIPDGDGGLRHVDGIYENGDCEDATQLLEETRRYLAEHNRPTVNYEGDVISLGKAGYDAEGVDLGDSVQIVDTTFTPALRLEGRVLEISEDLTGSMSDTTLTLGNIIETATERRQAQQQQLDGLINSSGAWSSAAAGTGPYVTDLIGRVNEIMNATGGYVYQTPGQGILIYDRPVDEQPTQAMQLGGGYWRIADSRTADGEWDWRSLADGKGIYADVIYTGRLSDAAGLNYWNLDTGEFSLSARTTVGGKTIDDIAADAADNAMDALDQTEIFNRLTNNGQTQGIYLSGGLLYVNATYINTGILRGGSSYWNLDTGDLDINGGSISISGYYSGRSITTTIDTSGLSVKSGSDIIAGLMLDTDGDVVVRAGALGPDSSNYLRLAAGDALELYSNGSELLSISGSTSQYTGLFTMQARGYTFLKVGREPSGDNNSTVIQDALGDTYPRLCVAPSVIYAMTGESAITISDSGWADTHGVMLASNGNTIEINGVTDVIQLKTSGGQARVDLPSSYAAIVYGSNHVMVNRNGITLTGTVSGLSSATANIADSQLMSMAENGLDLDSPDAYGQAPVAMDEITITTVHDVLRALADGDTATAKTVLDEAESRQRVWTQRDLDRFAAGVWTPDDDADDDETTETTEPDDSGDETETRED